MADLPAFAVTPRVFAASVSTANTNRDGSGTLATLSQAGTETMGASGTKFTSIVCEATGDPADSIVNVFIYDGTTNWFFDSFDLGNPAAASTTVDSYRVSKSYADLVLPSGYKLKASITVSLTAGAINVFAFGADF
jgi:hypothetical protein